MVYCTKCGTKNEDESAVWCTKCGANLQGPSAVEREHRKADEECFGLPHGGIIAGIIIGIIIILVGLASIPGLIPSDIREITDPLFWPAIIIVFGILIIAGALYNLSRR